MSSLNILSASMMEQWEQCPRKFRWMRDYDPRILSNTGLLARALETALTDPDITAEQAVHALGASHTVSVPAGVLPYTAIRNAAALAAILAEHLKALKLTKLPAVDCGHFAWQPTSLADESGTLHRIALVDHWDDDRRSAEAHSWRTAGDLAFTGRPMVMEVLVIGSLRDGRRHSPWTKGLLHPRNRVLRFAARNKKHAGLNDEWTQVWREDRPEIPAAHWLRTMEQDDVLRSHSFTLRIEPKKDDPRMDQVRLDADMALSRMDRDSHEMRRSACDWPRPCPFQSCCYAPIPTTPADLPAVFLPRHGRSFSGRPAMPPTGHEYAPNLVRIEGTT